MFNFNPSEVPATKSSMEFVASLLAVVKDPVVASQHLAEMTTALEQISHQHDDLAAKQAQFAAEKTALTDALDEREAEMEKREAALADINHSTEIAQARKAAAEQAEASLAGKQKELVEREDAVSHRENSSADVQKQLDAWRDTLDARQTKLNAAEADYQQRAEKLKAFLGSQ